MQKSNLAVEWSLLQNQFDSYEKYSLLIKLINVAVTTLAVFFNTFNVYIFFIVMIIWLQDGIWKTFQARIETRLLVVEGHFSNTASTQNSEALPFQFNQFFTLNRPGGLMLIKEYMLQALRPTVAYPHVLLMLILGYNICCNTA